MMRAPRHIFVYARRAFTLIELLVVIGIIAMLAGLVLAVGAGVASRSERQQVAAAFTILDQAIVAFEQSRGQALVFDRRKKVPASTTSDSDMMRFFDIDEVPPSVVSEAYIMPRLIEVLASNQEAWQQLSMISPDVLRQELKTWPDGVKTKWNLRDTWGEQIAVVPPGRPATRGEMKDARTKIKAGAPTSSCDPLGIGIDLEDATVRTADEASLQTACKGRQWLFLSKGPDRQLGLPSWNTTIIDANNDKVPDWDDNVLSYEPGKPGP